MPATRRALLAAVALALCLFACAGGGKPDPEPEPEPEPTPGNTTTFALVRAFSGDGTKIVAKFAKPIDAATVEGSDFTITSDAGAVTQTVGAAVANGDEVTLTLSGVLPRGPTYRIAAKELKSQDGATVKTDAVELEGTLHLALVWHQHQPVYLDPSADPVADPNGEWEWSRGPWVRKHATKDYYDMVAMLGDFPDIHVQVNLTPVLLTQLEDFYVARLAPYIDVANNTIDTNAYFAQRPNGITDPVTDPWIDLLLRPTPSPSALTDREKGWFWKDIWSNFAISEVMLARFPEYEALRARRDANEDDPGFTQDELLKLKVWFQLAWFDPRFLRGPVTLPDGNVVDLSDLVTEQADGTFTVDQPFTEQIAQRLVVEELKILQNVVEAHKALMYDAAAKTGQVEVMTTPFFHPILPLIADSDLAKQAMPSSPMPSQKYSYPGDANRQVVKAVRRYTEQFGRAPTGMWPAEGSVAEDVVDEFVRNGVRWIATDRRVLEKSTPANQPIYSPYRIDVDTAAGDGGTTDDELAIVFRDTELSDKIGFHYKDGTAQANVTDFMTSLRKHAPRYGEDRLLTIILDGENAWEWYTKDNDAIAFLEGMYGALTAAQLQDELRTVTVSEYLDGNPARKVEPHPVHELPELEPLFAASWISGSFSTWIGEEEENLAWDYLWAVRNDLAQFQLAGMDPPDPTAPVPAVGTKEWYAYKAWESMWAAEGSDWFWWYGSDQTAAGGDSPFDRIYIALLENVYRNARQWGITVEVPSLPPILRVCRPPAGPLSADPALDGSFAPDDLGDPEAPNEWTNAGAGVCQDIDSGTTRDPDDAIGIWYHGVTADSLWVALRMNEDVSTWTGTSKHLQLYFSQKHIVAVPDDIQQDPKLAKTRTGEDLSFAAGGAARELTIDFSGASPAVLLATTDGTSWGTQQAATGVEVAVGTDVVELKIPLATLNWQANDPLEMLITAADAGAERDRAPNLNSAVVFNDRSLLVEVTFVLDATGSQVALDAVSPIENPVPPAGTGQVFIVGGDPRLGSWTPNSVQMFDDGTHGDENANDNLWTFTLSVPPGTELKYKYTIGAAGESWGGTEEFPLTDRGFEVKDANGNRRMMLRDVFADRPEASGSLPARTQVLDP